MPSTLAEDKAALRESLKKLGQLLRIVQVIGLCLLLSTLAISLGLAIH